MSRTSRLGRSLVATLLSGALLLGGLPGVALAASSDNFSRIAGGDPVAAIAKIFAKSAIDRGAAVGVGLGILMSGQPPASSLTAWPTRPVASHSVQTWHLRSAR